MTLTLTHATGATYSRLVQGAYGVYANVHLCFECTRLKWGYKPGGSGALNGVDVPMDAADFASVTQYRVSILGATSSYPAQLLRLTLANQAKEGEQYCPQCEQELCTCYNRTVTASN